MVYDWFLTIIWGQEVWSDSAGERARKVSSQGYKFLLGPQKATILQIEKSMRNQQKECQIILSQIPNHLKLITI